MEPPMQTDIIKLRIEKKTQELVDSNPFILKARTGTLTRSEVITYLHNLKYVFEKAPGYLSKAAKRAHELGQTDLSQFYSNKVKEETGHEEWAKDDLVRLGQNADSDSKITPSAKALMKYVEDLINEEPHLYLSYMTFVEYFTVLASPNFLKDLEMYCGIRREELTAILNHQIADQDHVIDDLEILGTLAQSPTIMRQTLGVIDSASTLVGNTLKECIIQ